MKSATLLRGPGFLAISGAIICLFMLIACGNRAGIQVENKDVGAGAVARSDGSAIAVNTASPATPSAPIADKAIPPTTQTRTKDNARVSGKATPQVGTGGSDLFLFTQARAALGDDDELKSANIMIDVKGGLLTLSGTVENASQKSKAEQLVAAVHGVKAVKNQLRISIAAS